MSNVITVENPRGKTITFDEADHKYFDEKDNQYRSVTTIIKSLFPEFEKEKISFFVARKRGVDQQEVLDEWQESADIANEMGTKVHRYAECVLKGEEFDMELTTEKQKKLVATCKMYLPRLLEKYEFVEAEKIVFSPKYLLAGTVDLIMKHKESGKLCIFDWKTNKEIKPYDKYGKTGKLFLSHLGNCNLNHYKLQLNLYRRLLTMENYGNFNDAMLALFHISESGIKPYRVTYMDKEIDQLLEYAKEIQGQA